MGEHSPHVKTIWVRIHRENIMGEHSLHVKTIWVRIHREKIMGEHSPKKRIHLS